MWRRREKTGTALYDESGCNMDMTRRSPGCGSQRLLRCRLHPAGRCPNSFSLFPPLAAVVAVASGLTDGSRAVSTKKEDPLSELQLREGVFFLVSQMTSSISTFTIYSLCHSPQKSSAAQKVYKRPLRRFAPAPPKGEPLACRATSYWTLKARYGVEGRALLQRAGL